MKIILLSIFFIIFNISGSKAGWEEQVVTEDHSAFYYVGVSDKKTSLKDAMNEAYLEALKEAVRHSFGFKQSYTENYQSTLKYSELFGQMNLDTPEIKFNGIRPHQELVLENQDRTYTVYRQIRYDKNERNLEIARQKNSDTKNIIVNKVKSGDGPLGGVTINTKPTGALVTLTKTVGSFQISATSNAHFQVPIGEYNVSIHLPNFHPKIEKILVTGSNSSFQFRLEEGKGRVNLKIHPLDALVYLNNLPLNLRSVDLPVGGDYIVRVEHPDYFSESKSFSPWFNENLDLEISLRPKMGKISFLGSPEGVSVYCDDLYLGLTPLLKKDIGSGEKIITLKKSGYKDFQTKVAIFPNKEHPPISYLLKKESKTELSKKNYNLVNRWQFTFDPIVAGHPETSFFPIAFGLSYFPKNWVSLGLNWRAIYSEEIREEVDYETNMHEVSFNTRFYPLPLKNIAIGIGPEVNFQNKTESPLIQDSDNPKKSSSKSSVGAGIDLKVYLNSSFGVSGGYRIHDFNEGLKTGSIGIFFEF